MGGSHERAERARAAFGHEDVPAGSAPPPRTAASGWARRTLTDGGDAAPAEHGASRRWLTRMSRAATKGRPSALMEQLLDRLGPRESEVEAIDVRSTQGPDELALADLEHVLHASAEQILERVDALAARVVAIEEAVAQRLLESEQHAAARLEQRLKESDEVLLRRLEEVGSGLSAIERAVSQRPRDHELRALEVVEERLRAHDADVELLRASIHRGAERGQRGMRRGVRLALAVALVSALVAGAALWMSPALH